MDSPSSLRSRFSSRILSENGSRAMSNLDWSASSRKMSYEASPTLSVALASKLLVVGACLKNSWFQTQLSLL